MSKVHLVVETDYEPEAVMQALTSGFDEMGLLEVPDVTVVEPPGRIVLVSGGPGDGYVIGGPFGSPEAAIMYAESQMNDSCWWVMEIEEVEPDSPGLPPAAPVPETDFEF